MTERSSDDEATDDDADEERGLADYVTEMLLEVADLLS